MKAAIAPALVGLLTSTVLAGISAHVYRADEVTPLTWADPNVPDVFQEIMVGTRLTIFIDSDTVLSNWSGGLWVSPDDWLRGTVSGRDFSEDSMSYEGSILGATAGDTRVFDYYGSSGVYIQFELWHGTPGEWFVLDYRAEAVGTSNVGLYSLEMVEGPPHGLNQPPGGWPSDDEWPLGEVFWIQGLTFNHVLSRDYDGDQIVDFNDFAVFAGQWQQTTAVDPNATSSPDLNADGATDLADLALFCEYWLDWADTREPAGEPNAPDTGS